jgi:integrase
MCDAQPATLAGLRNRAVLLVGFASAMRRGELAALDVEDLRFSREGLQLKIRKSKTDQESRGQTVALPYLSGSPYCPVLALRAWLDASGIKSGALFRRISKAGRIANRTIRTRKGLELSPRHSGESIAAILKAAVKAIGKDPAIFGGHSLRSGHATQAAKNGAEIPVMMKQTRHTSVDSLAGYIRDANLFEQNSASLLGL